MALDWLPILPDATRHRRRAPIPVTCVEPLQAAYTPAPDILASLTFFPLLAQVQRPQRAKQSIVLVEPFDSATRVAPLNWAPLLGQQRERPCHARQETTTIDPTYGHQMAVAARMSWAPRLPAVARGQRTDRPAVIAVDPFPVSFTGCLEWVDDDLAVTTLLDSGLTGTDLLAESFTSTDLIAQGLC